MWNRRGLLVPVGIILRFLTLVYLAKGRGSSKRPLGRLDVLVNNAGTAIPKPFEEATLEEMDRVIDINVRGTLVATQAALKHIKSGGRIIMIGSAVGERVLVPGLVPYSATKGAVKIFTQALSRELGSRGITVNNVQPGPIDNGFESRSTQAIPKFESPGILDPRSDASVGS